MGRKPKRDESQKVKKQREQCWKLELCAGVKGRGLAKFSQVAKFS